MPLYVCGLISDYAFGELHVLLLISSLMRIGCFGASQTEFLNLVFFLTNNNILVCTNYTTKYTQKRTLETKV